MNRPESLVGEVDERHDRDRGLDRLRVRVGIGQCPEGHEGQRAQRWRGRPGEARQPVGDRTALVADPVLEFGIGDVEAGAEFRRLAIDLPVAGFGLELHGEAVRVEADPARLRHETGIVSAKPAAQPGELLAQAGGAVLGLPVAPQLVLHEGAGAPQFRCDPEKSKQTLRLAPSRRQIRAIRCRQPQATDEAQCQPGFLSFPHRATRRIIRR